MKLQSQQDPALCISVHARHVPHAEDHGRLAFAGVRTEPALGAAPILESKPLEVLPERLVAARLEAVRLKAASRNAARLKAALGFPDKRKAVSKGVRKYEHPTDRGARDGCGVLNIGMIMCMRLGMCVLI